PPLTRVGGSWVWWTASRPWVWRRLRTWRSGGASSGPWATSSEPSGGRCRSDPGLVFLHQLLGLLVRDGRRRLRPPEALLRQLFGPAGEEHLARLNVDPHQGTLELGLVRRAFIPQLRRGIPVAAGCSTVEACHSHEGATPFPTAPSFWHGYQFVRHRQMTRLARDKCPASLPRPVPVPRKEEGARPLADQLALVVFHPALGHAGKPADMSGPGPDHHPRAPARFDVVDVQLDGDHRAAGLLGQTPAHERVEKDGRHPAVEDPHGVEEDGQKGDPGDGPLPIVPALHGQELHEAEHVATGQALQGALEELPLDRLGTVRRRRLARGS